MRGEMSDQLPYVPRLDLWYLANSVAGTLPEQHKERTQHEISRAEGWALHHYYADDVIGGDNPEEYLHRGIGIYRTQLGVVEFEFPSDVEIVATQKGDFFHVDYHTPKGTVGTVVKYTDAMQRLGISYPIATEFMIKTVSDYPAAGYIFEHMRIVPRLDRFVDWQRKMGEDGVPVATGLRGASPVHHIQRDMIDPTQFYFHYKDHQKEMRKLVDQIEHVYDDTLKISCESSADVVQWGSNFDDMLTYPPLFEKEFSPWIRKASEALGSVGKLVICHTDGENFGLMDLIRDSGMHVAESICPHPMTKVTLEDYYRHWSDKLTLFGGIPSTLVIADSTPEDEFEAYLDRLFQAVAPGRRMVVGIADQVPPAADFGRLVRIGERIEKEGRLPLEAGAFRPVTAKEIGLPEEASQQPPSSDQTFDALRNKVILGDNSAIGEVVQDLLEQGHHPQDILNLALVAGMEEVGRKFGAGEVFIPEVLLSARAMNHAFEVLESHLDLGEEGDRQKGKILIGTVQGDLHSIGKNIVVTMLKGVGFEVKDMGVDVSSQNFIEMVAEYKPDVLALSALLTTTMPEMKKVIEGLTQQNLRNRLKVIVGGAPVSESFARDIGADGYAADAMKAVALTKQLIAPA